MGGNDKQALLGRGIQSLIGRVASVGEAIGIALVEKSQRWLKGRRESSLLLALRRDATRRDATRRDAHAGQLPAVAVVIQQATYTVVGRASQ